MSDDEVKAHDLERDRGILTMEDRQFLVGEMDYENPQSARRTRARIRQRVTNALLDFKLLRYLEDRDRDQIFEDQDLGGAFASAYAFLYDGLLRYWEDYEHVDMNLKLYLEQAIQNGDFAQGYRTEFNMETYREELDEPEEVFQRAKEQGFDSLTWPELEYIWESSEVNADEFAEYLSQILGEDIPSRDIRYERRKIKQWQHEQD